MRVVVTGSNGLVGSRLCHQLLERKDTVFGLARGAQRVGRHEHVSCDLTDRKQVEETFSQLKPDVVIHCASMTDVDGCERDVEGAYAANVDAAAIVARASTAAGAHLVHVSTDYVFDGEAGPYSEEALPNPRGVYALTKHMGEQAAQVLAPSCAIARTAVVYGWPAAAKNNFGSWLVSTLAQGQQVRLFEDQFVSPSLADSVASILLELGERKLGGVWNVCGADVVDRVTFGRAVCEVFGFDLSLLTPVKMKELKLASPRPLKSGLKVDKVRRELRTHPLEMREALRLFHAQWSNSRSER